MSERYWITGCQLGMIKAFVKNDAVSIRTNIEEIVQEIEDNQFIGNKKTFKDLGVSTSIKFDKSIYSHDILMQLENKCQCSYPLPLGFELLTGQRNFICPKCGRDNTPVCYEEYGSES